MSVTDETRIPPAMGDSGVPAGLHGPTPGGTAPSLPADYEQLKAFHSQYGPALEAIAPYLDEIRPIIEDEQTRDFWRTARRTFEASRQTVEPELDPGLARVRDEFKNDLAPVIDYVRGDKEEKERRKREAEEASKSANLQFAQRLASEHPKLAERGYAGIGMLASYAAANNMSLEEAWRDNQELMAAAPRRREAPPTSLRGESAAPGVPGESTQQPIRTHRDLSKRLASLMRSTMGAGR